MMIRPALRTDIARIGAIAEAAGLFPADYLPEMIEPGFNDAPDTWLVAETNDGVQGFAFTRPEEMAERVWNILAIAVDSAARRTGLATALLHTAQEELDARMILIDTTQTDDQAGARALYAKEGYDQVAQITDYFAPGEHKITFRKVLA